MVIERYSHVMHLVSNVTGTLNPGMSSMDVLRASFPAGTLTGAPVEAMKLIDELEPVRRGIYGGAAGYLSYGGEMDVAIAIRTGVIKDARCMCRPPPASSPTQSGSRMGRDRSQGPRRAARGRAGAARPGRTHLSAPRHRYDQRAGPGSPEKEHAADDRQLRFVYLQWCSTSANWARTCVARNDQITLEEIAALNPDRICVSPGPARRPRLASRCP